MNKNEEKYNYINIIEEKLNNDINPIDDENLRDIYKQKPDYNQLKQANSFQGIQDILRQMKKMQILITILLLLFRTKNLYRKHLAKLFLQHKLIYKERQTFLRQRRTVALYKGPQ